MINCLNSKWNWNWNWNLPKIKWPSNSGFLVQFRGTESGTRCECAASSIIHGLNEIWNLVLGIYSCSSNKYSLLQFPVTLTAALSFFCKLPVFFFNKTQTIKPECLTLSVDEDQHLQMSWFGLLYRELLCKINMLSWHADSVLNWPFKETFKHMEYHCESHR